MRLVGRLATETLTSQQSRVQAALERVRMAFPPELQFQQLLRSVCDQWLQTLPKVQLAVLQHLLMSLPDLPSHALQSNADTKAVVARLAALTREPRSADLRRYSQMLLAGLARLNNDSFANILQSLAGPMQQRVAEGGGQSAGGVGYRCRLATATASRQSRNCRHRFWDWTKVIFICFNEATLGVCGSLNAGQQSSSQQGTSFSPEEMSSCIRQAAQDIQSLTGTSSAGRATWAEPRSVASAAAAAATSSRNGQTNQRLANRNYQQQQPAYQLPSYQADPFSADDYQQLMMQPQPQQQSLQSGDLLLADIVRELSGARNQRHEQRKFCMQRLIGLVRDKTALNWDDHFKNILLILLETLSENESDIRACALSALQELLRAESARFVDFVEVTVLKVLEAHRDQDRSVAKAADDCAKALSACLPADQILRVLIPIVLDSEVPITLAAIKMEMRVVQEADS
uniref:TOG domain-containing protein n=1 Tax=Macrostomum lignano TaxID=282301 RepID=A0A1I8JJW5_9PLAT